MKQTGERWAAPEVYRIHGSLLCREPLRDDRAAMRLFKRSLASARKLGAVGWELRTAISIARLVTAGGSASGRAEARDLLISTRAKFASAETSRDLREADDLVKALGAERGNQAAVHGLDGDRPPRAEVAREIHGGHAATAKLALERVAVAQGLGQHVLNHGHRFHLVGSESDSQLWARER